MLRSIVITAFITLFLLPACTVPEPLPPEELTVEYVNQAPGKSKDDIYKGIKVWIAQTFNSAKDVIDLDDPASGTIIAKGIIPYPNEGLGHSGNTLSFVMKVDVKEGRYRTQFSNLVEQYEVTNNPMSMTDGAQIVVKTKQHMDEAKTGLDRLNSGLLNALTKAGNDNW